MLPHGNGSSASEGEVDQFTGATGSPIDGFQDLDGERDGDATALTPARLRRWWVRYGGMDWLCVIVIGIVTFLVDQMEPYHKPMTTLQLQDANISLPYLPSIVSNGLLIFLAVGVPLLIFLAVFPFRRKQAGASVELRLTVLAFCTCILLTLLATDFGKKYVGRPRPNFISYTGYNFTSEIYTLPHNMRDAFQSFPSGHSSTAFAGLGFLTLWLYANLYRYWRIGGAGGGILAHEDGLLASDSDVYRRRKLREAKVRLYGLHDNQLPLLLLITVPLWLAAYIAFTRVRDNHHNYDDILAGAVLGSFCALGSFHALYKGRRQEWLRINEAAFQLQIAAEQAEMQAAAGASSVGSNGSLGDAVAGLQGRPTLELRSLTWPGHPGGAQPEVPQRLLEAVIHKPGASPVPGIDPDSPSEERRSAPPPAGHSAAGSSFQEARRSSLPSGVGGGNAGVLRVGQDELLQLDSLRAGDESGRAEARMHSLA